MSQEMRPIEIPIQPEETATHNTKLSLEMSQ